MTAFLQHWVTETASVERDGMAWEPRRGGGRGICTWCGIVGHTLQQGHPPMYGCMYVMHALPGELGLSTWAEMMGRRRKTPTIGAWLPSWDPGRTQGRKPSAGSMVMVTSWMHRVVALSIRDCLKGLQERRSGVGLGSMAPRLSTPQTPVPGTPMGLPDMGTRQHWQAFKPPSLGSAGSELLTL